MYIGGNYVSSIHIIIIITHILSWSLSAGVIESSKNAHEHFQLLRVFFLGNICVEDLEAETVVGLCVYIYFCQ